MKKYKDHDMDEMHKTQQLQMTNTWKSTRKTPRDRLTEISTSGAFNRKHRNPIWGEKKQRIENHTKKSPT